DRNLQCSAVTLSRPFVVGYNVHYEARLSLPRIEMNSRSFHRCGDLDFVTRPGFNGYRARKIFQLEPNVLAGGEMARDSLLCERTTSQQQDEQKRQRCQPTKRRCESR